MAEIFTEADKTKLTEALKAISSVKADINKAKLANIDVTDVEKRVMATEASLQAIKRVYFPSK